MPHIDAGDFLRPRYYNPATGRFTSLDPFDGFESQPQSLHKYIYAHDDPVNNVDPTGLFTIADLASSTTIRTMLRGSTRVLNTLHKYHKVRDVIDQIQTAYDVVNRMTRLITTLSNAPAGTGWAEALRQGLRTAFGISPDSLAKFMPAVGDAFDAIGSEWKAISKRIAHAAPEIAAHVASDPEILGLAASAKLTGDQFPLVINLPSPPPHVPWSGIPPITVGRGSVKIILKSNEHPTRLIGFGTILPRGKRTNDYKSFVRIDYWNVHDDSRSKLSPHYHVAGKKAHHWI